MGIFLIYMILRIEHYEIMKHLARMGKIQDPFKNHPSLSLGVGMGVELVTLHGMLNWNDGKWNLLNYNSKKFNSHEQRNKLTESST